MRKSKMLSFFRLKKDSQILYFFFLLCLGSVFLSFCLEKLFGYVPCKLCLIQRYLFLICSAIILCVQRSKQKCFSLSLLLANFITIGSVAFYQLLIQFHLIADKCVKDLHGLSIQKFEQLIFTPQVPCSTIGPKIFGFPLSFFSFCIGMIGVIFFGKLLVRLEKWHLGFFLPRVNRR